MDAVSWCLLALSFVLGLVLTLAFTIRRVKREVPGYPSADGPGIDGPTSPSRH
jgi:hypothetical protein